MMAKRQRGEAPGARVEGVSRPNEQGGSSPAAENPAERKISLITAIMAVGFVAACIFHYLQGTFFRLGFPFNTFLFSPGDQFNDFFHTYFIAEDLNPYFTSYRYKGVYYPFTYLIVYTFTWLKPAAALLALSTLFTAFLAFYNWLGIRGINAPLERKLLYTAIVTFMSYPYFFLVDRGNTDIFVILTLGPALILYTQRRWHLSAVLLGLAAAFKLYPAVLGLIFLADRRYKPALTSFATFLGATLVSLLAFKGSLGANLGYVLQGFGSEIQGNAMLLLDTNVLQRSVSLFTFIKWFLVQTGLTPHMSHAVGMKLYVLAVAVVFCFVAWFVVFREQRLWRRVFLLTLASIVLPHVSADYRLILLYLPLMLYLREPEPGPHDVALSVIIGLLMIPKAYYFMYRTTRSDAPGGVSEGVVINPLLLLLAGAIMIYGGLREWNAGSATRKNSG